MANITRRSSIISKDGNLICRICLREKPETKFLTPQIKPGDPLPEDRDPKLICRSCNQEIVQDWKARGDRKTSAARIAAEERVADRYRRAASPELAPQAMKPTEFVSDQAEAPEATDYEPPASAGQGFPIDVESKLATEERAMSIAMAHYADQGVVERVDRDRSKSWDIECSSEHGVKRIEVKGTSGDGSQVFLTANEADNASAYEYVALFVVPDIRVIKDEDGKTRVTESGEPWVLDPWIVDPKDLTPTQYRYRVPGC